MPTIKVNKQNIEEIITALNNGAVLVTPTDTVYGLVCDAAKEAAVEKVFEIKKRDRNNPIAIFVKDIKMAKQYAQISKEQEDILNKSWPGAVTFVLKSKLGLAPLVYKANTIGMRIPDYDLIKDIFRKFDRPLAQTSANISGQPAPTRIKDVLNQLGEEDVLVIDAGDLPENKPSKVIDLTAKNNKIIRE